MRVLVTGDRYHDDAAFVKAVLSGFYVEYGMDQFTVIEGQCPYGGADKYAEEWAKETSGVEHRGVPAEWDRYGKSAGPIRNKKMLDEEHPDIVLAFHDRLDESKGTKHMIEIADKAGVPVYHFRRISTGKLRKPDVPN